MAGAVLALANQDQSGINSRNQKRFRGAHKKVGQLGPGPLG